MPSRAVPYYRERGRGLDTGTPRRWWRKRDEIWAGSPHQQHLAGGGRKKAPGVLEDILLEMIVLTRLKKEKITREWIAIQALQIHGEIDDGPTRTFQASSHWVSSFMKRNDLSLRRRANFTTLSDEQLVGRAVTYMRYLGDKKSTFNFAHTILMDETAVYFEDARELTVDVRGSRHGVVKSTGFASMRVTVVLAVTATGVKLSPLVIWKHKKGSRTISKIGNAYVVYQPKAWVDSELLCNWIDSVFPVVLQAERKALVWDSMRAHISKSVKSKCAVRDIAMCVIPGGLTAYLQAVDEWKNSDRVEYTRAGNPRPQSVEVVAGWVQQAWKDTDQSIVDNSIASAGFSLVPGDWFIWRHDVYGRPFQQEWDKEEKSEESEDEGEVDDELANALDDIELMDE
ncbi:hypothetical protein PC129_g10794 [Phytophthora cactorum]|uniref:HTH CENPB-type domain-containing protein n=1 Tax=Phytophthora cactorum TaxID=29920 RepID=A0A8T0YYQ5_9STRA|nr:hypothetical protein PC111_g11224 [Phytophthora cactorum]KAG2854947.1 hypothetical protein PC113_g12883 [Phytophthora cactorum]KAG2900645.1 hypothetical protein PC114_g13462 [Phytophthora cactorum]KAG2982232.1 hypothetical protein PC118_g10113 [Phytophthora cactorum]KAG3010927.1 hypothetical protein PC119_g13384 [Phytophthora cactorum]